MEGAEHVLDGVDLGVAVLDGGLAHEVADEIGAGLELGRAVQVDAAKDVARIDGGWFEGEGDRLSGVESLAG